jgi:hypothetical protein
MEIHRFELCGVALDLEFCHRCRKSLCFDVCGKDQACTKSHPNNTGFDYCQTCLDELFLLRGKEGGGSPPKIIPVKNAGTIREGNCSNALCRMDNREGNGILVSCAGSRNVRKKQVQAGS